jgi:hypothetical protein
MAKRTPRHLLGVGTQDGFEPSLGIRGFHLRSTFNERKEAL